MLKTWHLNYDPLTNTESHNFKTFRQMSLHHGSPAARLSVSRFADFLPRFVLADFLAVTLPILQRIFIVSYYNKLAKFIFFSLKIWSTYSWFFTLKIHFLCVLLTWCHNFGLTPSAVRGIKKWDHSSCANFIQTFRTWNCFYFRERLPDVADTLLFRLLQTDTVYPVNFEYKRFQKIFWCTQEKHFTVVNI